MQYSAMLSAAQRSAAQRRMLCSAAQNAVQRRMLCSAVPLLAKGELMRVDQVIMREIYEMIQLGPHAEDSAVLISH